MCSYAKSPRISITNLPDKQCKWIQAHAPVSALSCTWPWVITYHEDEVMRIYSMLADGDLRYTVTVSAFVGEVIGAKRLNDSSLGGVLSTR